MKAEAQSRRSFLTTMSGTVVAPFVSRLVQRTPASHFDPSFGTATDASRAIRAGVISSRELTQHVYARIRKHNPRINAFVTLTEAYAMERARAADNALANGKILGPLHGVPILIKDCFETAGVRTTSGSKRLEQYIPAKDAAAVHRLIEAGAVVVGKTNMPELAADHQSFNDIAGTTNNPWDVARTPGGSTGGGAAALATGFGFLELGSDIGGSIRVPSNFCGVYGHKPSLNIVPIEGHIPPLPGELRPVSDLNVAGPLARSAHDLRLALEIIAGPIVDESIALKWTCPPPRGSRLKDYRVGYVVDDPFCPVTLEVSEVLARAVDALRKSGVELTEGWPRGMKPQDQCETYLFLVYGQSATPPTAQQLESLRSGLDKPWGLYARKQLESQTASHKEWLRQTVGRLQARAVWQEYFKTHDAFLMPVSFMPAFPHDHRMPKLERMVTTSLGQRPVWDLLKWISFANVTGCPATAVPVGRSQSGLPVGVQVVGPFLEDATPIHIGALMGDVIGGFEIPAGFAD